MGEAMFDFLRAKIEAEISQPGVVAITSATNQDGNKIAGQALAKSLSATGYSVLLIDANSETESAPNQTMGYPFDELGRRVIANDSPSRLTVVTISAAVQQTTNQRHIKAAFESFRDKFDYTIICAGFRGSSKPFAATVVSVANGVLVTIKLNRRKTREDARLAADLDRLGPKFLGLISITQPMIDMAYASISQEPTGKSEPRRTPMPQIDKTIGRREVAEWPT